MGLQIPFFVYMLLLYVPIAIAFSAWLIILIGTLLNNHCKNKWNEQLSSTRTGFIKLTFVGNLYQEKIEGTNKRRYIVFDYPVSPKVVRTLASICLKIWLAMFVSFWSTFLLEISHNCDITIDCFFGTNNSLVFSCESLDPLNVTDMVHCYKFELDLVNSLGNAGGLQGLLTGIIYGQLTIHIWLQKKISQATTADKRKWKALAVVLIIIPIVLGVIVLLLGLANFLFFFTVHNSPVQDYIILLLFVITLLACASFPIYLMKDEEKSLVTFESRRQLEVAQFSTVQPSEVKFDVNPDIN